MFLNGRRVGGTGRFPPDFEKATLYSRTYALPPQAIRAGRWNEVTVHVFNHARSGGIVGRPPRLDTYDNLVAARHREAGRILESADHALFVVKAAGGDAVNLVDCGEPSSERRAALV